MSIVRVLRLLAKPLDVVFPAVCLHCHERIKHQEMWLCGNCYEKLSYLPGIHCPICGYPDVESECDNCEQNRFAFTQALSVFMYDGAVKTLIHELKYNGFTGIAEWFAAKMYQVVLQNQHFGNVDYVTAVPLHRVRKRERGFNQSELIARALALKMQIPYTDKLIKRMYNTVSQTLLDKNMRRQNLGNAFGLSKLSPDKLRILIIDDVFTTGTTVNEATKVLKVAGAEKIYILTISHGI